MICARQLADIFLWHLSLEILQCAQSFFYLQRILYYKYIFAPDGPVHSALFEKMKSHVQF